MADERDLELLDDYLTNQMSDHDRSAFEQKLKADPDLQHEYALQKRLIQGIKDARVAELKSMLNNVAVPTGAGNTLGTKALLGTLATIIIAGSAYWFLKQDQIAVPTSEPKTEETVPSAEPPQSTNIPDLAPQQQETSAKREQPAEQDKNQTSAGTEHSKPSLAKKPDPLAAPGEKKSEKSEGPVLDVFTPENEVNAPEEGNTNIDNAADLTPAASSLIVETDRDNRRYNFHYQFKEGKLFLYGPFEKNLYEIMEFFADDKRTVFLFYKDHYYLLPEADQQIRPLSAITDAELLKKLKEYRNSK
jgi:hypothetical protein